jgi:hypothetical protein
MATPHLPGSTSTAKAGTPRPPAQPQARLAPRRLGALRRSLTVGIIRLARRVMPLLVALSGEHCWDCGRRITPTVKLSSYHIVEARLWAWEEVICDQCVRTRLRRFGGLGPKH